MRKKDVGQKLREEKIQKIQDVILNTRQKDKFLVYSYQFSVNTRKE